MSDQAIAAQSMELVALTLLNESQSPIGAARLASAWKSAGLGGAEATAGRFLRNLDEMELTQITRTTRGRVLTDKGRARLEAIRAELRQESHESRIRQAVNASDVAELVDLLHIRRLIETEAAALAAARATEEEIELIVQAARDHARLPDEGGETTAPSMHFHRLVAEASHNRMLIAVAHMLLDPENDPLEKVLEAISVDLGATANQLDDHMRLAEALRLRDADQAQAIMLEHINRLIATVETYRNSHNDAH